MPALILTAALAATQPSLLFDHPVSRDGFHFQVAFGPGGGPDSEGLFHAMEIGGTFAKGGWTLGILHTFIQNRFIGSTKGGADLFGGWMPQIKVPVVFPELVIKFAAGLGGTHDQSDGIKPSAGVGWSYGLDFHLPFFERHGATIGLQMVHAMVDGRHHFGGAASLGYTLF